MFAANYDELSALGREQATTLGQRLADQFAAAGRPGFDVVLCGPASRHRDTAARVGEGFAARGLQFPEPRVIPAFDEHDGEALVVGAVTQLTAAGPSGPRASYVELATRASDATLPRAERGRAWHKLFEAVMREWLAGELSVDAVEDWPSFSTRVRAAFAELLTGERGQVALFTSVGPTAVMLGEVLELPPAKAFEQAWRLYNASTTRFVYSGTRTTLDAFNEVALLPAQQWTHR